MGDSAPPNDRRSGERLLACFAAEVERPDGAHRASVIRDLSETGALLLVQTSKVAVGDEVKLQLYITDDPSVFHATTARIVRIEPIAPGEAGPWRQRVAVQFSEPLTAYGEQIRRFHEQARRFGVT
jgi:hypothetical protein